jgi:hypothetical protein
MLENRLVKSSTKVHALPVNGTAQAQVEVEVEEACGITLVSVIIIRLNTQLCLLTANGLRCRLTNTQSRTFANKHLMANSVRKFTQVTENNELAIWTCLRVPLSFASAFVHKSLYSTLSYRADICIPTSPSAVSYHSSYSILILCFCHLSPCRSAVRTSTQFSQPNFVSVFVVCVAWLEAER